MGAATGVPAVSRAEALRLADSLQDLLVLGGVHTDPVGQQSVETLRRWPENESDIASLYEELRRATDGGSESMTHADAVQAVRDQDKRIAALEADRAAALRLANDLTLETQTTEEAVLARFGLPPELPACVKHADLVLLLTEKRDLMPAHPFGEWDIPGVKPLERRIRPWVPEQARTAFLRRFEELTNG